MTYPAGLGLLRIATHLPWLAERERSKSGLVYVASDGRSHVIADLPNGYLHSAAAKLRRERRQPEALAAMDAEIARREAAKPPT